MTQPIYMMPMIDDAGGVMGQAPKKKFRMSQSFEVKYDPLKYLRYAKELGRDEANYIEVILSTRLVKMYGSPLKKYRTKRFDVENFRRMLSKHRVMPIVHEDTVYLMAWENMVPSFTRALVVDYLWEFHEINYYFDGGWADGKVEPIRTRSRDREMPGMSKDEGAALLSLLDASDEVADREMPTGTEVADDGDTPTEDGPKKVRGKGKKPATSAIQD